MSKKNHPNRLPTYAKVSVSSLAAAFAGGTTDAAIVYFEVSPDKTTSPLNSMNFGSINLGAGTYSFTSNSFSNTNPYFGLGFTGGGTLYNTGASSSIEWGLGASSYVLKLTYGSSINPGAATIWRANGYNSLARGGSGYWDGGANAYAALRIDQGGGNYNYGWVAINYDASGPVNNHTATVTGFAFESTVNTSINAGVVPVPEPSTYAQLALAGLFGAAVWHHRRHQRGAAPALLQLAAGARGVEKFRADKTA